MAVTSLLVNACVLFCRIPLTVLWGDEGNGIYAAAYGGFFVFWLVSAYAVPVAVSGLLKSRLKRGQNQGAGMVIKIAFLYAAIVGLALSALLFLGSDYIAAHILPEPLAVLPIRVLSPALLFMSLSSVLRGFFLGSGAGFPAPCLCCQDCSKPLTYAVNSSSSSSVVYVLLGSFLISWSKSYTVDFWNMMISRSVDICGTSFL